MPQYLVIAWDGTDSEAPQRRQAARAAHLACAAKMFADGRMKEGGAILNDQGGMIGSSCVVEFADRAELDAWLASDPYVVGDVWKTINVHNFRCAPRA
jgi:uncharacterized protein YciI